MAHLPELTLSDANQVKPNRLLVLRGRAAKSDAATDPGLESCLRVVILEKASVFETGGSYKGDVVFMCSENCNDLTTRTFAGMSF